MKCLKVVAAPARSVQRFRFLCCSYFGTRLACKGCGVLRQLRGYYTSRVNLRSGRRNDFGELCRLES